MKARFKKHTLNFIIPGGTSRGVLKQKTSYYLIIANNYGKVGIGEVSIISNLSIDDDEEALEVKLTQLTEALNKGEKISSDFFKNFPSIKFAYETALLDLQSDQNFELYSSAFTKGEKGQKINGLIWMGSPEFMTSQIENKLNDGFSCLKLKIGAINFEEELFILKKIRSKFSAKTLEIRVDANGAFSTGDCLEKLGKLAQYKLHSIEQPIKQGQWNEMAELCKKTPIPIALDEELIGVETDIQNQLLSTIKPQYIILKPSLIGGFEVSNKWIENAAHLNINWWLTSALESNIGLNAIAQFAFTKNNSLPQGLGTGQLYNNNIPSPLTIKGEEIWYLPQNKWDLSILDEN